MLFGVILSLILNKINTTRRTDFISGCASGSTLMSQTLKITVPYAHLISGCVKFYDSTKDDIDSYLDIVHKEGL